MYGDAPSTLSVSIVTVPFDANGWVAKVGETVGRTYVNWVSLITLATLVEILYAFSVIFLIFIGVPAFNLWGVTVVIVIIELGVFPSPDWAVNILTGSDANAPTISYSGLWGANPDRFVG